MKMLTANPPASRPVVCAAGRSSWVEIPQTATPIMAEQTAVLQAEAAIDLPPRGPRRDRSAASNKHRFSAEDTVNASASPACCIGFINSQPSNRFAAMANSHIMEFQGLSAAGFGLKTRPPLDFIQSLSDTSRPIAT